MLRSENCIRGPRYPWFFCDHTRCAAVAPASANFSGMRQCIGGSGARLSNINGISHLGNGPELANATEGGVEAQTGRLRDEAKTDLAKAMLRIHKRPNIIRDVDRRDWHWCRRTRDRGAPMTEALVPRG